MTEIELLPLPEPNYKWMGYTTREAEAIARANVARATEPLKAEIERLRAERDTVVKEATKYAERSGRALAEVDRLRRMVQERDNMLGRRPCAGVNADGNPRCFELVDARAEIEILTEALQWYAEQAALCRKLGAGGDKGRQALDADGGKRAYAALRGHDQESGNG